MAYNFLGLLFLFTNVFFIGIWKLVIKLYKLICNLQIKIMLISEEVYDYYDDWYIHHTTE